MAQESNFVDYVKIYCRSGKGGRGSTHLRREKYIPKGGPDGGDGGNGGSIYIRGNRHYWTLLHLRYNRHIIAPSGESGGGALKTGASGADVFIDVPCGTTVHDAQTGEFLLDITQDGKPVLLLPGGRGGKGNTFFKSPTNQTPRFSQPGEPAQERVILLQLKVLADVGLVGFPNAGKSTLLSVISAAKPKIAGYPFTTLEPNLGMVAYRDGKSFVVADIPGIIEGAAEGKGLGLRFLRHIERNSLLLFMVSAESGNIAHEYRILCGELEKYNPGLLHKRRVLAVTKCDLIDAELVDMLQEELADLDIPCLFISAVAHQGITELKDCLWQELNAPALYEDNELVRRDLAGLIPEEEGNEPLTSELMETAAREEDFSADIVWDQDPE